MRERDLPGMETEAGNYARIRLANLLDQMPIFLKGNIRMVEMLERIEHKNKEREKGMIWKGYLRDSINGKTNNARFKGCCN